MDWRRIHKRVHLFIEIHKQIDRYEHSRKGGHMNGDHSQRQVNKHDPVE